MESCIREYADIDQLRQCKANIEEVQTAIQKLSKALNLAGNEVRLKILYLLNTEKAMCPCDLSDVLEMTVPAISQHLRKLKDVDIIRSEKKGQTIFYSLNNDAAQVIISLLGNISTNEAVLIK
ncbi:ArsR/SmtB family transcription factor [Crocinitomix algicola]|uniref:ArsR/SmtB family transcription factor n=1 Tax=Crocinitomix algicola TaxID=1740263 RepID=UPI00082F8C60|nr:metalloregulator ArsR/SmtB family transcription factor [Crocinitomix algicola]